MSLLIMWARWQSFNPKCFAVFAAVFMTMEVIIQLRRRLNLTCQFCGFDPVLYRKNPEAAARTVKDHLDHIRQDPDFLLSGRVQETFKRLQRLKRRPRSRQVSI
jgi:hypothetical protein